MPTSERDQGIQLGTIISQGNEHGRQLSALFAKLDKMERELSETAGIAKEALRLSNETSSFIKSNIQPAVEDYRNLKAKGLGVLGVIAIMGGGAATVATKVVGLIWPTH